MKTVLISTYEMGRQPFGLASPAAWLRREGIDVDCFDLAVQPLDTTAIVQADLIAFYLPMHTATRIASGVLDRVRELNSTAHYCAFGLYAPMNSEFLGKKGIQTIIGGEFEERLTALAKTLLRGGSIFEFNNENPKISLARQQFIRPDRSTLPASSKYAHLEMPDGSHQFAGYTEASRGCKYLCRHCPVVPVYKGQFRVVQRDVVLDDVRQQVAAGVSHITFGDPDFFNGIKHGIEIVSALNREFPYITYDITVKVEHLLEHRKFLPTLVDTGCLFVTTAVESLDDRILLLLDKGHTKADFFEALELCRKTNLTLLPTFVAFNPWITLEAYEELLSTIASLGLTENVASVQLALRLLIPAGSRLLELSEVKSLIEQFDEEALCYRWKHTDPRVDELQMNLESLVAQMTKRKSGRGEIFRSVWHSLQSALGSPDKPLPDTAEIPNRATIPYLNEPWYC